jgi:hypothetical protein
VSPTGTFPGERPPADAAGKRPDFDFSSFFGGDGQGGKGGKGGGGGQNGTAEAPPVAVPAAGR